MEVTYVVIVALVTYIIGAFTKLKWGHIPNKYIPLQNVCIGVVSGIICFVLKLESSFIQSFVLCITATMGAGGAHDLLQTFQKSESDN